MGCATVSDDGALGTSASTGAAGMGSGGGAAAEGNGSGNGSTGGGSAAGGGTTVGGSSTIGSTDGGVSETGAVVGSGQVSHRTTVGTPSRIGSPGARAVLNQAVSTNTAPKPRNTAACKASDPTHASAARRGHGGAKLVCSRGIASRRFGRTGANHDLGQALLPRHVQHFHDPTKVRPRVSLQDQARVWGRTLRDG